MNTAPPSGTGGIVLILRLPERLYPGKFDLLANRYLRVCFFLTISFPVRPCAQSRDCTILRFGFSQSPALSCADCVVWVFPLLLADELHDMGPLHSLCGGSSLTEPSAFPAHVVDNIFVFICSVCAGRANVLVLCIFLHPVCIFCLMMVAITWII